MTDSIHAHVDSKKLDAFLHDYVNTPLPRGSVSTILTEAFNALVGAGVVVVDQGPPGGDDQFYVHGGRVLLDYTNPDDQTAPNGKVVWAGDGVPSFDPVVQALADLMVAVLNSAPHEGPLDFPHTRN